MAARGWYPDPSRRARLRYWDGARWSNGVVRSGDPPGIWSRDELGALGALPAPTEQPASQLRYRPDPTKWVIGLVVLWIVGGIAVLLVAAMVGITDEWVCADAGARCDSHSAVVVLILGVGGILLTTALVIVHLRRAR